MTVFQVKPMPRAVTEQLIKPHPSPVGAQRRTPSRQIGSQKPRVLFALCPVRQQIDAPRVFAGQLRTGQPDTLPGVRDQGATRPPLPVVAFQYLVVRLLAQDIAPTPSVQLGL